MSSSSPIEQLSQITGSPGLPPSVLVLSPDEIRKRRITKILLQHLFGKGSDASSHKNVPVKHFKATELTKNDWRSIREDLLTISLFSQASVVVIDDCEKLQGELQKEIIEALKEGRHEGKLFLLGSSLPATSIIKKFFVSKGWLIELEELKGVELKRWTQKELKSAGFQNAEAMAIDLLVNMAEESPDKIAALSEQLSLYASSTKLLAEDLHKLFPDKVHSNEFVLVEHMLQGKIPASWIELSKTLQSGKAPLTLLGLVSKNLQQCASISFLKRKGYGDQRIQERLNMPPWLYRKLSEVAKHLKIDKYRNNVAGVLLADSKFKNYSLGDNSVFSELIDTLQARK